MPGPVREDGSLNDAAIALLHAVTGVDEMLLRAARIRPSRTNWLHAPWYNYHCGGAITVGRTIWFTRIWFEPSGLGDGSLRSSWRWLIHLAHEVGHLQQAERFGRSLFAKARYVSAFTLQYAARALFFRTDVHDGSRLEREADLGRQVLLQAIGDTGENHPAVLAVHRNDSLLVREWCAGHAAPIAEAIAEYRGRYPV